MVTTLLGLGLIVVTINCLVCVLRIDRLEGRIKRLETELRRLRRGP